MQISGSFLSNDLVQKILSDLPGTDLARSSSVCTAFNNNATENVWRKVFSQDYPTKLLPVNSVKITYIGNFLEKVYEKQYFRSKQKCMN